MCSELPANGATLSSSAQNSTEDSKEHRKQHYITYAVGSDCWFWRYVVVLSNPHGPQQSDVIGQELSEDEEIAEGLLLMQLLHLIFHFRQL